MRGRSSFRRTFLTVLAGGAKSYIDRIVALGPIAYYPLNELSGTAAVNYGSLGTAANGSYTGATLAAATGPGGKPCPSFDGTNDLMNAYSAAFAAAFNGALGSIVMWAYINPADAGIKYLYRIGVDANNYIYSNTQNLGVTWAYSAGGTGEFQVGTTITQAAWYMTTITWSKAAEQVKYYLNAGSGGTTDTALGIWAGAPAATLTLAGDTVTTGGNGFKGSLSDWAIYDRVLGDTEIANLYAWGGV